METSYSEQAQSEQPDIESNLLQISRLECLGGIIVSPLKTFEHLAGKPQWLFPLVIVVFYVLVGFVAPMVAMSVATMPAVLRTVGNETAEIFGLAFAVLFSSVTLAMSLMAALIVFIAMAGSLYTIIRIFKVRPSFYALVSTLAYAEFVPRLSESAVKKFISLFVGKIHPLAPDFPTGILPIFSEFDVPILLQSVLGRIELFHLWSFALVAIAVRFVAKVSSERAMLITLLYWAVCILMVASAGALSRMSTLLLSGF